VNGNRGRRGQNRMSHSTSAAPHPIDRPVLLAIRAVLSTQHRLEDEISALMGNRRTPTLIQVQLLRIIVIAHCENSDRSISAMENSLKRYASPATVRSEIKILTATGLIFISPHLHDRRVKVLNPSKTLVNFFNDQYRTVLAELSLVASALNG
jgi:hypothetical protein